MRSTIVAVLSILAFAPRASHAQSHAVPVVITWDYYAQPKVLVLHALNNSGKDIVGYTFVTRYKKPDGTIDQGSRGENTTDMLSLLISSEMAKDPGASESIRLQNSGTKMFNDSGNGIFFAGQTRDTTLTGINSASEQDITAGVVFYADGTYDKQDDEAFKRMLAVRQGALKEMKEANELTRNALADETNAHPVAAVLTELNKRRVEAMDKPGNGFFPMDISNLQNMQRPQAYGPDKGKTERERLTQYVEDQEKRVELMTPHCHLEISVKQ
jgi:hypothetical protein